MSWDDASALTAAIPVFEGETPTGRRPDSRLLAFLTDAGADGIGLPTTYAKVDDNFVTLLRLAARHGLVLVDLNARASASPRSR